MIERRGRVYDSRTAAGFARMRNQGVPQPPIRVEDAVARALAAYYGSMFRGIVERIREVASSRGFRFENKKLVADADPTGVYQDLLSWLGMKGPDEERIRKFLNTKMRSAEKDFFERLTEDAPKGFTKDLLSLALPHRAVFESRIEGLRREYLDSAVERISGERDALKRRFLNRLVDWVEGKTETLDVSKIEKEMQETSMRRARYFARDQFSRFNKALTISTYETAEAPFIEVLDTGDGRVRPTHQNYQKNPDGWGHRIFTVDALKRDPRYSGDQSFGCRCGFVPHWELTDAQRRKLVA